MIERIFSPELVRAMGWTLVHTLWQAAAFALLLGGLLVLLRKYSALTRYVVAIGAMAAFLLTAGLTFSRLYADAAPALSSVVDEVSNESTTDKIPAEVRVSDGDTAGADAAVTPGLRSRMIAYYDAHLPLIVTLWLMGVLLLQLRFLGQLAFLQRLKNYGTERFPAKFTPLIQELEQQIGVGKPVRYLRSFRVESPFTVGWLRPAILFPTDLLSELAEGDLRTILAHELAHVKRHDFLVNLGQTLLCILFFYHPAVWWMSARVEEEREHCCDDLAIAVTGEKIGYAKTLLRMKESSLAEPQLAMAYRGKRRGFQQRISRLLSGYLGTGTYGEGFTTAVIIACCIGLAVTLSGQQEGARTQVNKIEVNSGDTPQPPAKEIPPPPAEVDLDEEAEPVVNRITTGASTRNSDDLSILMLAIRQGEPAIVRRFLETNDIDLNQEDEDGFSPLMAAASEDEVAIAELLLEAGADVNYFNRHGWTALTEAADEGALQTARLLIKYEADVNLRGAGAHHTPLSIAASEGHVEMIVLLVGAGGDVFQIQGGGGPLQSAAEEGQLAIVKQLIGLGADVNAINTRGRTALSYAAEERHTEVVRYLLDQGARADIADRGGLLPADYAAEEGATEIFRLLSGSVTSDAKQTTLLLRAAREGQLPIVRQIIEAGLHPDQTDEEGNSALGYAAREDETAVVRYLLGQGAEADGPENGRALSPLTLAARENATESMRLLLGSGADGEARCSFREIDNMDEGQADVAIYRNATPLMVAVVEGNKEAALMLIRFGADADAQAYKQKFRSLAIHSYRALATISGDELLEQANEFYTSEGWTPLMEAAELGNAELVSILLEAGADKNHTATNGMTALSIAISSEHASVVRLLK